MLSLLETEFRDHPTFFVLRRDAVQIDNLGSEQYLEKPVVVLETRDTDTNSLLATGIGDDAESAARDLADKMHASTAFEIAVNPR